MNLELFHCKLLYYILFCSSTSMTACRGCRRLWTILFSVWSFLVPCSFSWRIVKVRNHRASTDHVIIVQKHSHNSCWCMGLWCMRVRPNISDFNTPGFCLSYLTPSPYKSNLCPLTAWVFLAKPKAPAGIALWVTETWKTPYHVKGWTMKGII